MSLPFRGMPPDGRRRRDGEIEPAVQPELMRRLKEIKKGSRDLCETSRLKPPKPFSNLHSLGSCITDVCQLSRTGEYPIGSFAVGRSAAAVSNRL